MLHVLGRPSKLGNALWLFEFRQAHCSRHLASCVPAGRNIHALDPYRMPSIAALERGMDAGRQIVQAHRDANSGSYPETVRTSRPYPRPHTLDPRSKNLDP